MAIFQPSQIVPDVRSGLGLGVVDATQGMTVSWRINGQSAMTGFSIAIYLNDAESTMVYTTGKLTAGCPAYGTTSTGEPQMFSYTISSAALSSAGIVNGGIEYKLIITQWWGINTQVRQSSASVFITRDAPTLSISAIGTDGVISTRFYTFTGNYLQTQGDTLNWFRWRIAYADNTENPFFDTENVSGTMDISAYYDGFFTGENYSIRLTCQTDSGVEADTGWVNFSCSYATPGVAGTIAAQCAQNTDAVIVQWGEIGYIPGTASGYYSISDDNVLTLPESSTITWNRTGTGVMSFPAPWSVIWKGTLSGKDAVIFTVAQSTGDITLTYSFSGQSLTLAKGGTTLAAQSGIINSPTVTALLTATNLYLRVELPSGGLYPSETLYPASTLYPAADTQITVNTYTLSPSYTQSDITSVQIGGYQLCNYIEVLNETASAEVISEAITNGTYVPALGVGDYMMADWTHGLNGGTLDIGGDTLTGFALYRRLGNDPTLIKVAQTDTLTDTVYDYGAASQQGAFTYYLFPLGATTYIAEAFASQSVSPCWWNWTLMECARTQDSGIYNVVAAYRFGLNIESGTQNNNNAPNILKNFTRYPTVQLSPANYKSGSLSGLIGAISWENGQPQYADSIALREAIYALSTTSNALFLKNRKGDLMQVRVSTAISMDTDDATREQMQTMTLPWIEVGSAENVSLYSTSYVGA